MYLWGQVITLHGKILVSRTGADTLRELCSVFCVVRCAFVRCVCSWCVCVLVLVCHVDPPPLPPTPLPVGMYVQNAHPPRVHNTTRQHHTETGTRERLERDQRKTKDKTKDKRQETREDEKREVKIKRREKMQEEK